MSERTTRKKNATGEKDVESNSITSMLVGPQGEQSRVLGANLKETSTQSGQGDSVNTKNLGPNKNSGDSVKTNENSSKNQGDIVSNDNLDSIQGSKNRETNSSRSTTNPIIITEDLVDDRSSENSNELNDSNLLDINKAFKQIPVTKSSPKKKSNQSIFIERSNSEGQLVNQVYLDALRSKPPNVENLTDKDAVFKKAMSLTMKGDGFGASKYLKVYESLSLLGTNRPSNKRATSANPVLEENRTVNERSDGGVFKNGMWFFPDWQNKAMGYHVRKKAKSVDGELKSDSYTGLPYGDEWLLDYGEWSIHYNGYITALRNAKFVKFVEWSLAHKANVERVLSLMGWMTALKYDIRVREEALINRVEVDGLVAPPDISEFNQVLAEECFGETRLRDESLFKKNPYVEGGERYGWDPATGKPPKKSDQFKQNKPYQKWNNDQQASGSNYNDSAIVNKKPFEKKKFARGYQGNNFDENYKEKRAASVANKNSQQNPTPNK
ncbi:uncharacterized protein MELLADRAFT_110911 [Melampsora larici-populina 98AG31]|uniref:Uncharacterized protein n=1 Tax=Melampsora larici-populina (strain 98AG31 / pathotype 3-4-7) TaxID=747676 RepID=F4S1E9_MELLP|nr:uncharacterized protein MELLADRAFT_110911 [Melampsora larici-populina 98AG31]EGG01551.1 hypothetical protein MELLADRAFT_110911 [Melampsora larici-populina 98AG31]